MFKGGEGLAFWHFTIHHICINSLFPSVKKINIGNPGKLLGGGGVTWISNIGFCVPGNQQINANMVGITDYF